MGSDELNGNIEDVHQNDKETQPTITAVFRLLQDVETRLIARFDAITTRIDQLESRFTTDIADLNTRVTELNTRVTELNTRVTEVDNHVIQGFKELTHKTNALNRRALQQEADYEDLFERIERLESKAL